MAGPTEHDGTSGVSTTDFRTAIGHFATGVTVVTALAGDRPQGITVNALASVSLDPPLVVVALGRSRYIVPTIEGARRYAVNILTEDQLGLSDCFAGAAVTPGRAEFCGAPWHPGATGLPLLDGSVAAIECEVVERFEVGDHLLFVGRVEATEVVNPTEPPLLYLRRRYLKIERARPAPVAGKPESPAG